MMIVEDLPELKEVVPPKKATKLLMDFDQHPVFIFLENHPKNIAGLGNWFSRGFGVHFGLAETAK